jgi:hypothetical protein
MIQRAPEFCRRTPPPYFGVVRLSVCLALLTLSSTKGSMNEHGSSGVDAGRIEGRLGPSLNQEHESFFVAAACFIPFFASMKDFFFKFKA